MTARQLRAVLQNAAAYGSNVYLAPVERKHPAVRIIGARSVKGTTEVQLLSTGVWCELQPGDAIYTQ